MLKKLITIYRIGKEKNIRCIQCINDYGQNIFDTDIHWYKYWKHKFDCIVFNKTDTWDWQWIFYQIKNRELSIVPKVNLVSNIGFSKDATHTHQANNPAARLETHSINFPLKHPMNMKVDVKYEEENVKWVWCYHRRLPKLFYLKKANSSDYKS